MVKDRRYILYQGNCLEVMDELIEKAKPPCFNRTVCGNDNLLL